MENPIYVLRTNESAWAPTQNAKQVVFAKNAVRVIFVILLLGSFVFGDNLFGELSLTAKALLIALFLGTCFIKDKQKVAKPFEIRFYADYLELYRKRRYYSPKVSRKELSKFMYKDIEEIVFRTGTHRLNIYGIMECICYKYNRDGSLPEKPCYHKTTDSLAYFYTNEAPEVNFVEVFEKYTPVKVTIQD